MLATALAALCITTKTITMQTNSKETGAKALSLKSRFGHKQKPLIAVNLDVDRGKTTNYKVNRAYIQAILSAGGVPLIIPPMKQKDMIAMLAACDGILLIGGRDYNPERYGETACSQIDPLDTEREEFDFRLVKYVIEQTRIPVLGICGGMQLLNIYFGGSLHQHIETSFPGQGETHRSTIVQPHATHDVALAKALKLRKIYRKATVPTVSSHHQSVKVLGKGLTLEAIACGSEIVEAFSGTGSRYLIGVQWHPEQDYAANKLLFRSLITAASR